VKVAALAGRGDDLQLAAQQAGDLAADRQAQARAAVLAAGGAVGLLEGLEDDPLLVLGNADAGVGDREGQHLARLVQVVVAQRPAGLGAADESAPSRPG
jgi:hypothetical protein